MTRIRIVVSALAAFMGILAIAIAASCLLAVNRNDISGWVQAVGAILAIVAGFAVAAYQVQQQREDAANELKARGEAALLLAFEAFELIGDRLGSALSSGRQYELKGARTTEMVTAMREFETARLPTPLVSEFIKLRSCVFAINDRITELYRRETGGSQKVRTAHQAKRYAKLASAVRVHGQAKGAYTALTKVAADKFGISPPAVSAQPEIDRYAEPSA